MRKDVLEALVGIVIGAATAQIAFSLLGPVGLVASFIASAAALAVMKTPALAGNLAGVTAAVLFAFI